MFYTSRCRHYNQSTCHMIKNYTSKSKNTFDVIQKCLASHGAQKLMFDYNDRGEVIALSFAMEINGKLIGFKLPARIEQVEIRIETRAAMEERRRAERPGIPDRLG